MAITIEKNRFMCMEWDTFSGYRAHIPKWKKHKNLTVVTNLAEWNPKENGLPHWFDKASTEDAIIFLSFIPVFDFGYCIDNNESREMWNKKYCFEGSYRNRYSNYLLGNRYFDQVMHSSLSWARGKWLNGDFRGCLWEDGVFINGTMTAKVWMDGVWVDGKIIENILVGNIMWISGRGLVSGDKILAWHKKANFHLEPIYF